jgi:hypothetical protein
MQFQKKLWLSFLTTILPFILLVLVSCGNSSNGSTSSNKDNGNNGQSGNTSIKFTGDFQGALTSIGSCGISMGDYKAIWYDTIGRDFYSFQILATKYKGPGAYTTGPGEGPPNVGMTNQTTSKGFYSQYSTVTGTIVVNADETSGTINVTLVSDDKAKTTVASGSWVCSKF